MKKQYILLLTILTLLSLQLSLVDAGWFSSDTECGTPQCIACGTYTDRTIAGQVCCNRYSSSCYNYNACSKDHCINKFVLANAKVVAPSTCVGAESINCLQYGEYCSEGICTPCQCEQGECCDIATVGSVTRGCLYKDSGTQCKLIDNIPAGTCSGTSTTCNIYDENTNNICYETLAYDWNSQIPADYDYPKIGEDAIGSCCGDDGIVDMGSLAVDGKFLCAQDRSKVNWKWLNVLQETGSIYQIENPVGNKFDVLSDGSKWNVCNNELKKQPGQKINFGQKILAGHKYICYNNNNYAQFAECKGDGNSNNRNEGTFGQSFSTGQFIIIDSIKYYCTDSYDWVIDLDLTNRNTCEKAGFGWTGTKCCGDRNYLGGQYESYNDNKDGCLKNEKVANNTKSSQQPKIVNLNGKFYSCNLDSAGELDDTNTAAINDLIPTEKRLTSCGGGGNFFCDPATNQWSSEKAGAPTAGSRNTLKTFGTSTSCCPSDWCWDGSLCNPNLASNATAPEDLQQTQITRCVNGGFTTSYVVKSWDDTTKGFCPLDSDCLVNPIGDYSSNYKPENYGTAKGDPQCIRNDQSVLDHYCNNREWTSRTKFLANQLLKIAGTNYILFCDSYTTSLNDFKFTSTIEDYLGGPLRDIPPIYRIRACVEPVSALYKIPCVNNFCILSSDSKIYFGTSLDQPVNSPQNSILEALEFPIDYCDDITSGDTFQKCSGDNKIWYNPKYNSIIYARQGTSSMPAPDPDPVSSKLNPVVNYVKDNMYLITPANKVYSWISVKDYNKIYINKQGNKEIYAIYEISNTNPYLAVKYTNIGSDMCLTASGLTGIDCQSSGNSYYIASQSQSKLPAFWPQLTSKIRLS